jgi:hypothetical protein
MFTHRTLQEYLAASFLCPAGGNEADAAFRSALGGRGTVDWGGEGGGGGGGRTVIMISYIHTGEESCQR